MTKPSSDLIRVAAKALRQVTNRERDKPYRRAVAATRRGSDRLSNTIRAFSSSDQRRRRPVSTNSSRFSLLIVWLSIRTVLNPQASPPQGGSPRKLMTNSFCRTDPEIAKAFARVTFTSDNREDLSHCCGDNCPSVERGHRRRPGGRRLRQSHRSGLPHDRSQRDQSLS